MMAPPHQARRIAVLQGCSLYRAQERRAAALGAKAPVGSTDPQLARCGTELEAVVWFWWHVTRQVGVDDRTALLVHRFVHAGGRFCLIDFALSRLEGDGEQPGVALFLDDPLDRRQRRRDDRSSALTTGGWTVLRLSRDEILRDPLAAMARVRERLAVGFLTEVSV